MKCIFFAAIFSYLAASVLGSEHTFIGEMEEMVDVLEIENRDLQMKKMDMKKKKAAKKMEKKRGMDKKRMGDKKDMKKKKMEMKRAMDMKKMEKVKAMKVKKMNAKQIMNAPTLFGPGCNTAEGLTADLADILADFAAANTTIGTSSSILKLGNQAVGEIELFSVEFDGTFLWIGTAIIGKTSILTFTLPTNGKIFPVTGGAGDTAGATGFGTLSAMTDTMLVFDLQVCLPGGAVASSGSTKSSKSRRY